MDQFASPQRFRFPTPTDEDLPALSRLAYDVSATECRACRNYHLLWPYLRSVGVCGGGPEAAWQQQIEILAAAVDGLSHVRWLIAGAADAGVLALVTAVMRSQPEKTFEVTVVDRCPTPLALCRAYAEPRNLAVTTIVGQLEDFDRDGDFDLVLMHRTITFIAEAERAHFLTRAASWLAPGGRLVLALAFDLAGAEPRQRPNQAFIAWRGACIREAIANGELEPPEDPEIFVGRVTRARISTEPPKAHRREDYEAALDAAALGIDSAVQLRPDEGGILVEQWERSDRFILVVSRRPG